MCAVQVGKWMPSCPYDIFFKLDMYINNHKFRHIYIYTLYIIIRPLYKYVHIYKPHCL